MKNLLTRNSIRAVLLATASVLLSNIAFAAPAGCEAKGSLYILENGNQTLVNTTPAGAGTTAAISNQGHKGFKTDSNGNFKISFPSATLTPTQQYYFRMEVFNSQYLAYGIPGQLGNTFKTMSSPATGQILCASTSPSQNAGVKLGASIQAPITDCAAVNVGQMCGMWFKFAPTYHNPIGFVSALRASYPSVPLCSNAWVTPGSTPANFAPSTVTTGPSSGCFRRFWVPRVAAPQPANQWVPILKLNTWVHTSTSTGLTSGDQIAN